MPSDTCSFCGEPPGPLAVNSKKFDSVSMCLRCLEGAVRDARPHIPDLHPPRTRYRWQASYHDGTVIHQFYPDGTEFSAQYLDYRALREIRLEPQSPWYPVIRLLVRPGEKAIKYWQHTVNALTGLPQECREVLGLKLAPEGDEKHVRVLLLCSQTGEIVLSSIDNV